MAYRDERAALETRAQALRAEIDQLLSELEASEQLVSARERDAFWKRADSHPEPVEHLRPSSKTMRPLYIFAAVMTGLFGFLAVIADNALEERIGAMVVVLLFMALFVGAAGAIVRYQRRRSVDARLDADGLHLKGTRLDKQWPWHEVERLRVKVMVAGSGTHRSRTGYLAVRIDGSWHEHELAGISLSAETQLERWVDWVLGVRARAPLR